MKIDTVREKLSVHEPERVDASHSEQAAVAVVFREGNLGSEILFIERAHREDDPWSGHMAFPGGRREPADESTVSVAQRETFEEVGIELSGAEYLGRLDDLTGHRPTHPKLVIAAHAFHLEAAPPFVLDPSEVQNALWFPISEIHNQTRWVDYSIQSMPDSTFPGILVGEPNRHVVWGLTYRFLGRLLEVLDHPLPSR